MMSLSFPPAPTNGQQYQNWVWNSSVGAWLPNYQNVVGSFNGRGGAVTFLPTDNTAGNRVLLAQTTITTSVVQVNMFYDFTNKLYDQMEVDFVGMNCAADGVLATRFSNDGSTFDTTSNYWYTNLYSAYPAAGGPASSVVNYAHCGGVGIGPSQTGIARLIVSNPGFADRAKPWLMLNSYLAQAASTFYAFIGGGMYNLINPIKGIGVYGGSGNLTRGSISLYGVVKPGSGLQ